MQRSSHSRDSASATDMAAHPLSFAMPDVYAPMLENDALAKGERTLIRLKIGVVKALESAPYQTLTMSQIAREAGLSYGLFYHYFKDKEAAVLEVLGDFLRHTEQAYAAIHMGEDPYGSLYLPNLFYLDVNRRNPGVTRACLTVSEEVGSFREQWIGVVDRWHRRMAEAIRRHQHDSDALQPDAELVAYALGGMIDQLCRQAYAQKNPFLTRLVRSTEELAEVISILWYRAIYARDPDPDLVQKYRAQLTG